METYQHLVFYDGECGLCDQTVQVILKLDKHELFAFAPLQGSTAAQMLSSLPSELKNVDSVVLIADYRTSPKTYVMAQAVFRIFWLLGGKWMLLGWLSFLPPFLFNWAYRLVARYRHQLFSSDRCVLPPPNQKHRFLP